jgi:hypothetical protein
MMGIVGMQGRSASIQVVENGFVVAAVGGADSYASDDPLAAITRGFKEGLERGPEAMMEGIAKTAEETEAKMKLRRGGTYVFKDLDSALAFSKEWLSIRPLE